MLTTMKGVKNRVHVPIIQRNAERLRNLQARVNETEKSRSKSSEHLKAWQEACKQFNEEYNSLAFPGGLREGIDKIKKGDVQTIEVALNYLEDTPFCFRSQYVATDLKRALNKVLLQEPMTSRFIKWKNRKKIRTR